MRCGAGRRGYLLTGSLLYLVCTVLVTMLFNVPRNEALAAVDPASCDAVAHWTRCVSGWTAWNHVRTIAALLGTASLVMALR